MASPGATSMRDGDRPWFTEDDVRFLASLSEPIAAAFRRALLTAWDTTEEPCEDGPGVVFDEHGHAESISPACRPDRGGGCCCTAPDSPAGPRGARRSSSSPPPRTRWPRWSPWPTASRN